jgi:signal peptidase II
VERISAIESRPAGAEENTGPLSDDKDEMTAPSSSKNTQEKACGNPFRRLPDLWGHLLFWPLAVGGVALDLWSKKAIFEWLPTVPYEKHVVIDGFFQLILRENTGAAFSIAQGQRPFLVGISTIAFFAVTGIFLFGHVRRRITQIAMGCMLAGIVGNLYDRAFNNGVVRDFLDVFVNDYHWPTFNVADSMLCIGVGLLIISNFTLHQADQTRNPRQTAAH